jgi:hypothetical protein
VTWTLVLVLALAPPVEQRAGPFPTYEACQRAMMDLAGDALAKGVRIRFARCDERNP